MPDRAREIDVPEDARIHLLFERGALLAEAVREVDHQALAGQFGCREHLAPLAGAHRHGLFAQDVAAGREGRQGEGFVEFVGRGDADQIELFILQHLFGAGVAPGDVKFIAYLLQKGLVEVGSCDDLGARVALVSGDV